jgi:hypothetical protein
MKPYWAETMRRFCLHPIAGVLAAFALAGCAMPGEVPTAAGSTAATVTQQQRGPFIVLAGPKRRHAEPFVGVPSTNYYLLRSFIDTRTGAVAHQLYLQDSYLGAERVWNAARLATGQTLRFLPISKSEVLCEKDCSFAEEFAAALPEPLLRANPQGLTVVFTARAGNQKTIAVPGDLVTKQLAAVAAARANRATAAATSPPAPAAAPPR